LGVNVLLSPGTKRVSGKTKKIVLNLPLLFKLAGNTDKQLVGIVLCRSQQQSIGTARGKTAGNRGRRRPILGYNVQQQYLFRLYLNFEGKSIC
jgi:hypothetical protein